MNKDCEKCNPDLGDCDFCPCCSAGRLNLNERMFGDDD